MFVKVVKVFQNFANHKANLNERCELYNKVEVFYFFLIWKFKKQFSKN